MWRMSNAQALIFVAGVVIALGTMDRPGSLF